MQTQSDSALQISIEDYDESKLIEIIIKTFKGRTQQEVKQASNLVVKSLNTPGMMQKFVKILINPVESQANIKKAVALVIKKFSYECAQLAGDKSQLIESIYSLIMRKQIQFAAKQVLGTALEHLLCADRQEKFKKIILDNIVSILNSEEATSQLDGCLIVLHSYLNTLDEIQDQIDFFFTINQPLALNAMKLFRSIIAMSSELWLSCEKQMLIIMSKLFCFLESTMEVIFEQADEIPEDIRSIRENVYLVEVLESYLALFHNNHSIISTACNSVNEIKRVIMNVVVTMYKLSVCPLNIFKLIFITFLSESNRIVDDFQIEAILILCIEILDDHLERKEYGELFAERKLDIIFALFIYSVTNLQQYQLIEENPEKFVELAQDFTQANIRSDYLKIKAGAMIQVFIQKIDEALRNVVEILIMICAQILQPENKTAVPQIGQSFGRYAFYRLSDELKLQASCMILANLSCYINRRNDLSKLVQSFLKSHFSNIIKIHSHLPILRIMRLVSYYPTAIYFVYIQSQLCQGKIFILEGIKSFERIIRTNRYPQLLSLLASILTRLMGVVKISDPVMQITVLNQYETMLKKQPELYHLCRQKIKQEFYVNKDINQHATLICFNLMSALIQREKDEVDRNQIVRIFYEICEHLLDEPNKEAFNKYQEKLIQIFDLIITVRSFTSPEIEAFVERTMKHLSKFEKGSGIFKMFNNYVCKMEGAVFMLQKYFKKFWEEVKHRVTLFLEGGSTLEPISYYCLLMSQIIGGNIQLNLTAPDFDQILTIAAKVPPDYKQYPLIIFLSYAYENPYEIVNYLKKKNVYQGFLQEVTKVQFSGLLPKKVIILALIRLIEIEEELNAFKVIMEYCVKYLKLQHQKSKKEPSKITTYEIKPRRLGEDRLQQNSAIQEQEDDNQLVNIFAKFKHPYRNLSQYDNFKVILGHRHGFLNQLNPSLLQDIKTILQTQWVDNKTRRIVHVVK